MLKNRSLSEKFFKTLNEEKYKEIKNIVNNDDDLIMCLRGNYVTIYYKSMRILEISQQGKFNIDKHYGISVPCDNTDWVEYFKNAKYAIDIYGKEKNISKFEKEVQQAIVKENNIGTICNETDYFIIDIEYTQPHFNGRFDALDVHWPKNKRKNGNNLQLAFIEIKAGSNAVRGNSGVSKHYNSVIEFLKNLNQGDNKEKFIQDLEQMIQQHRDLGLWNIPHNQNKITLSRTIKPQLIFVLADYNPKSKSLVEEFEEISATNNNDLPFELTFATSSFVGYGLYDDCMLTIDEVKEKLSGNKNEGMHRKRLESNRGISG